jgi:hypothetical protein
MVAASPGGAFDAPFQFARDVNLFDVAANNITRYISGEVAMKRPAKKSEGKYR